LKLVFLIVSRAVSVLALLRWESWWKLAEILMLRHQLAVAQRERPKVNSRLTWPARAWLALLAGTLPIERLAAMRLIVSPHARTGSGQGHWPGRVAASECQHCGQGGQVGEVAGSGGDGEAVEQLLHVVLAGSSGSQPRGDQHGRGGRTCPHPICQGGPHGGSAGRLKCQTTTRPHSTPSTSIPYRDSTRRG
jgi:hypothetical protein